MKDGRRDFVILNTNMPGEADPDAARYAADPRLDLEVSSGILRYMSGNFAVSSDGGPRVQLIPHNKRAVRLAKIMKNSSTSCINVYEVIV